MSLDYSYAMTALQKNSWSKIFTFLFFAFAKSAFCATQSDPLTFLSAQASGKSGAVMGTSSGVDSVILNPAPAAFFKQYNVGVGYQTVGHTLQASVVDTKSSSLAGAFYYLRRDTQAEAPKKLSAGNFKRLEERFGLSLFTKLSDQVAFGGTGKYLAIQPHNERNLQNTYEWNGDLGFSYRPMDSLSLGVSVINFMNDDKGYFPSSVQMGGDYKANENWTVSFLLMALSKVQEASSLSRPSDSQIMAALGIDYTINSFSIRGGYRENKAWDERLSTLGFSYTTEKFRCDVSSEFLLEGEGDPTYAFDLNLFF